MIFTTWKVCVFGVFLVCIFPHSDSIRRYTPYLSVFSPNVGKYEPEKLWIQTLFTHCLWITTALHEQIFAWIFILRTGVSKNWHKLIFANQQIVSVKRKRNFNNAFHVDLFWWACQKMQNHEILNPRKLIDISLRGNAIN